MIRVELGDEPTELAAARARHLPRLQKMHADGLLIEAKHITGYDPLAVREALLKAQHGKCCYCEKSIEGTYEPLDHHRPKTRAKRQPGSAEEHGYWWLAHAWGNLLATCGPCNGIKHDHFPLDAGSVALAVGEQPPGRERPLLINPAELDGIRHIRFVPASLNRKLQWIPQPRRADDEIGKWTIKILQLDRRPRLLDAYQRHVEREVMRYVSALRQALRKEHPAEVRRTHDMASRALLRRDQVFVGLSYDALCHFIPDTALAPFGLTWRPPA